MVQKPWRANRQRFLATRTRAVHPMRLVSAIASHASFLQQILVTGPKLVAREHDRTGVDSAALRDGDRAGQVRGEGLACLAGLLAVVVRKRMRSDFLF